MKSMSIILVAVLFSTSMAWAAEVLQSGEFVDARPHTVSGVAQLLKKENGDLRIKLSDFQSESGPDLKVYLSADGWAAVDVLNLGDLISFSGEQEYVVRAEQLEGRPFVLIWCEEFGILFGSAKLQ